MNRKTIIFAVPKGRLFEEALEFLAALGFKTAQESQTSQVRQLVFWLQRNGKRPAASLAPKVGFVVVRAQDVPQFVYHGTADFGIVGNDVLREQEKGVLEPLNLGFGHCRLVLAGPQAMKKSFAGRNSLGATVEMQGKRLRVATSYPLISQKWFEEQNMEVEILPLYGSVEIAPQTGFADLIVDLVDTGRTLQANNLFEIRTILPVSARLIVNRASLKTKPEVSGVLDEIKKVCAGSRGGRTKDIGEWAL